MSLIENEFSKKHYALLKKFYKKHTISFSDIDNPKLLDSLISNKLVIPINQNYGYSNQLPQDKLIYSITYSGCGYVESHKRDTWRFVLSIGITNLISFAALIVSIIALFN